MSGDPGAPESPALPDRFQRAAILYDMGRLDAAESEIRRTLQADPDDARNHALLALCLAQKGARPGAAEREIARALELAPEDAHVHYLRAQLLDMLNRPADSEAAAREALRLAPDAADYVAYFGGLQIDRGKAREALETLRHGLKLDPESLPCLLQLARASIRLKQFEDAERTAREALRVDPSSAVAHRLLGLAILKSGRPNDAVESFLESCRINPMDAQSRNGLARCLRSRVPVIGWGLQLAWRFISLPKWAIIGSLAAAWFSLLFVAMATDSGLLSGLAVASLFYGSLIVWLLKKIATWTFDFTFQFDPIARRFLTRPRRMSANLFAMIAALGLAFGVSAAKGWDVAAGLLVLTILQLPPTFAVFRCPPGKRRRWMIAFAAAAPVSLAGMLLASAFLSEDAAALFALPLVVGLLASIPATLWIPPRPDP